MPGGTAVISPEGGPWAGLVAKFYKTPGNRLELYSLTVIREIEERRERREYDVDWCRTYGSYVFHYSGGGGDTHSLDVDGPYFVQGDLKIKERPTTCVHHADKPPWRSAKTRAIRLRNRTRRLRVIPKQFRIGPCPINDGVDLLDWLERNGIEASSVYCSICKDHWPDTDHCKHIWWCDKTGWWSTPSERCECKERNECRDGMGPEE